VIEFAGFDIILFLVGMMVTIGFLEERRFFEFLIDRIIRMVGSDGKRLMIVMMTMSALFAGLVDEVTSILFMASTVLHLTGKYRLNAVPFLMMVVFATNIGSAATVVGNPIGVMIALRANLTFADFLRWATPIAALILVVTILLCIRHFRGDILRLAQGMKSVAVETYDVADEMQRSAPSSRDLVISFAVFLGTIISLILHSHVEEMLHLEKNTMLLGTAMAAAGVVLLLDRNRARELVETRVDWWTLSFFIMLFASVGTLRFVGITRLLAEAVFWVSGGNDLGVLLTFTIVTATLSAFMDNVLAVATFIPVVGDLAAIGVFSYPLWWAMLFAGTCFGNLTLIGSTANIVAIGMLERRKRGHITFIQWMRAGAVVSIPTLILAVLLIFLQIPLMPR
jgi:Na+/H+ antiporter NhaD/arsenite permease-like protein